ncbi:MAG: SPOR domain-containing protein [Burkholderiales bacterium]|jgi:cell division protein FtsN|nr:SPOR domain-containing protein [Burkholderiales bacterium]
MAHKKTAPFRWGILFTGIFLGIVTGLVMALTAAWKLGGNAVVEVFASKDKPASSQRIPNSVPAAKTGSGKANDRPSDKPSFDFYKVLPEGSNAIAGNDKTTAPPEAPLGQRTTAIASVTENTSARPVPATASMTPPATAAISTKPKEIYWLQVGSFSRQEDADNRKAELALYGWEAAIQRGEAPGRGVFYRVRVGPYDSAEQTGRMKAELTQRKFDVAVVRQ